MQRTKSNGDFLVLVVEDQEDLRQTLISLIGGYGYQILSAENGIEALSLLEGKRKPDLIISDLNMPRMTGVELTSKIKMKSDLWHIPVLLLSAEPLIKDIALLARADA